MNEQHLQSFELDPRLKKLEICCDELMERQLEMGAIEGIKTLLYDYAVFLTELMEFDVPNFFWLSKKQLYENLIKIFNDSDPELVHGFKTSIYEYDKVVKKYKFSNAQSIRETIAILKKRYRSGFVPASVILEKHAASKGTLKKEKKPKSTTVAKEQKKIGPKEKFIIIGDKKYASYRNVLLELSSLGLGAIASETDLARSNYAELQKVFFEDETYRLQQPNGKYVYSLEDARAKVLELNDKLYSGLIPDKSKSANTGLFRDEKNNHWGSLIQIHKRLGISYDTSITVGEQRINLIAQTESKIVCKSVKNNEYYYVYCLEIVKPLLDDERLLEDQRTLKTWF